jgi:TRAP transporter 4TM/12TM fusion protein
MMDKSAISKWLERVIVVIAIIMSIYHLIAARFVLLPFDQHKVIHLGLALILTILSFYIKERSLIKKTVFGFMLFASLFGSLYFILDYYEIVMRVGYPAAADYLLGGLMVTIVLVVTCKGWGLIIPTVTLFTMVYAYFGQHLPWIFWHGGMSFPRLIAYSSSYFRGIYGSLTGISSMEVFLFVLFGCMLKAAGAIDFFMQAGMVWAKRFRSGPAQTAVLSSALFGTISGTIAANVATTGAFTIPAMIKKGFSKEYAGSVEACASTGGQIMPPVMGASAFIMAGITGISYPHIALAALIPALIYYIYLGVSIEIRAIRNGFGKDDFSIADTKEAARKHAYLVLPIIILVLSLSAGNPAATGAFHGIMSLIIAFVIRQMLFYSKDLKKAGKEIYRFLLEGLTDGAKSSASIAVILATMGIVVEMFVTTGFGQKLSQGMIEVSGGSLLLLLFMSAITCIFFGMGIITSGAYLLVALLGAPAMMSMGVPLLNAHMFVFYYAVMAAVTPPVAIGALVASGIAGGDYFKTALFSMRLALPGFLLPFFFIYRPEVLWFGYSPPIVIFGFVSALAGLVNITILLENFMLRKLRIYESILLILSTFLLFEPGIGTSLLGLGILIAIYLNQRRTVSRSVGIEGHD